MLQPAIKVLCRGRPALARVFPRQLAQQRHKSGQYGYTQVKALVYSKHGEPSDVLSLHTHSVSPSLPQNSILLRALATPINPADINQLQGTYPSKPPFTNLIGTAAASAVGGNEGCFEVVSLGSGVKSVGKGDWVIMRGTCFGTWRTHALAKEDDVMRIEKDGVNPSQVGTVSVNPCTAYRMLKGEGGVQDGEWVIQNGGNSGVGRAAVQLANKWGVKSLSVIRERENQEETEKLKNDMIALGATKVVTETELMERGFGEKMMEWTNGGRERVRLALNCVGGKPAGALVKLLSPGGQMVTYGGMSKQPVMLPTAALIFKDIRFSGFWVSRWAEQNPEEKKQMVDEILGWYKDGSFKDVPMQELTWNWDTPESTLKEAVQGTLGGFRAGKGIFLYGET